MAKFQINLNASNIISDDRKEAFQNALNDDHRVDCMEENISSTTSKVEPEKETRKTQEQQPDQKGNKPSKAPQKPVKRSIPLEQALNHTYTHQSRTMEIHQQYLAQQTEYIQLITTVIDQQGKALEVESGSVSADIIETFQRTIDNFHLVREQGLKVHQQFLSQQAEFSELYLAALEGKHTPTPISAEQETNIIEVDPPTEWVVQEPPIVLDERVADSEPPADESTDDGQQISLQALSETLIQIVADKTGYPAEMLDLDMDMEADLGIDSIKRVEILGALEDEFPTLPAADTEILAQTRTLQQIVEYMGEEVEKVISRTETPETQQPEKDDHENSTVNDLPAPPQTEKHEGGHSVAELTTILLDIVAEKTGYPAEMLETDMDMEADLGIDSIKRVEILGAMEEQVPGLPSVETEVLAEMRTLGQIVELMGRAHPPAPVSVPNRSEEKKKKVKDITLENTPVKLISLPTPDHIELQISKGQPLIVTNDGTEYTQEIIQALIQDGWNVILWNFPDSLVKVESPTPSQDIKTVTQESIGKEAITNTVNKLRTEFGALSGFIHLHPPANGNGLFSDVESQLIKQVFFIASEIKNDLENSDPSTRKVFLSVTRTDGQLGIGNQKGFQEGNGLSGLVKTLNWEWPHVFCRSIDFSQEISGQDAGVHLLQEIHDPDRGLHEVGINTTSRVTIIRENG